MSDGIINAKANVDGGLLKASFGDSQPISVRELPDVTIGDAGKVLKVNPEGNWAALNEAELPAATSEDAGKVLTVNSNGAWGLTNKEVVVNMNVPAEGNASFVDKTMDEIITLFNKGIPMIFKHNNNIYWLRTIDTTNKSLTLVNYTVTSIRLYLQSISFNSQGVGTILSVGVNIS